MDLYKLAEAWRQWAKMDNTCQKEKNRWRPSKRACRCSKRDITSIIRNEQDDLDIWQYNKTNPAKWAEDSYYYNNPQGGLW